MTQREAITARFHNLPYDIEEAKAAVYRGPCHNCIVCGSDLILPIVRIPQVGGPWLAHCNHCGSEVTMHAIINRKAWMITARMFNRRKEKCAA